MPYISNCADIPLKIPAVVNYAPEKFSVELRDIPRPGIGPHDVLLRVTAVGVCGSDLHQWSADHSWPVNYPVVLGHEFSGVIEECGAAVDGWNCGDRVVSETAAVVDMNSPLTRQGLYQFDPQRKGFGYGVDGAMTKFVKVPARCLHKIPDGLSHVIAAMAEPCCVAYSAVVVNAQISPGDRIVVLGPGPIGVLCAAMARLRGASVAVVGLPHDTERLALAELYGCRAIVGDATDWARNRDGLGADGVVDASGVSVALRHALDIVRPNGWISKVGWGPKPIDFSLDPLVQKNVRLQGSFSHNWPVWERVLYLLDEQILDVKPLIGGVWPIEEWRQAFETMGSGKIAKAILTPE